MIILKTESGSKYTIDLRKQTWKRERGETAASIRSDEGTFETILFGDSLRMICAPFEEFSGPRVITSTPIVEIEFVESSAN